jgi:DNA-binding response OmpR family regulator
MAKICVLEDDRDIREVIEWILEAEEYEVVSYSTIHDFMGRDLKEQPGLYLLDVMLPDGSGLDVCNHLRNESEHKTTPIVMMSAHANFKQICSACNADGFVAKPFELDNFLQIIGTHVKH